MNNIFGNFKKVIGYNQQNSIITSNTPGIENNITDENNFSIKLLKEESKLLKEKYNQILKENELLKQSIFNSTNQNNSNISKIFTELKTAFFSYENNLETNKSIRDFKNFLFENMLLYNSVDNEDIDILNSFNISDKDWNNNKDIYLFKQNLLEKNIKDIMENVVVSNEFNKFINIHNLKQKNFLNEATPKNLSYSEQNIIKQINLDNKILSDVSLKNNINTSVEELLESQNFYKSSHNFENFNEKNKNILEKLISIEDKDNFFYKNNFCKGYENNNASQSEINSIHNFKSNTVNFRNKKISNDKNEVNFDKLLEKDDVIDFSNEKNFDKTFNLGDIKNSKNQNVNFNNIQDRDIKEEVYQDSIDLKDNLIKVTVNEKIIENLNQKKLKDDHKLFDENTLIKNLTKDENKTFKIQTLEEKHINININTNTPFNTPNNQCREESNLNLVSISSLGKLN